MVHGVVFWHVLIGSSIVFRFFFRINHGDDWSWNSLVEHGLPGRTAAFQDMGKRVPAAQIASKICEDQSAHGINGFPSHGSPQVYTGATGATR